MTYHFQPQQIDSIVTAIQAMQAFDATAITKAIVAADATAYLHQTGSRFAYVSQGADAYHYRLNGQEASLETHLAAIGMGIAIVNDGEYLLAILPDTNLTLMATPYGDTVYPSAMDTDGNHYC